MDESAIALLPLQQRLVRLSTHLRLLKRQNVVPSTCTVFSARFARLLYCSSTCIQSLCALDISPEHFLPTVYYFDLADHVWHLCGVLRLACCRLSALAWAANALQRGGDHCSLRTHITISLSFPGTLWYWFLLLMTRARRCCLSPFGGSSSARCFPAVLSISFCSRTRELNFRPLLGFF